jgi:hypothetical protein
MPKERPRPPESVDAAARRGCEELIAARFPERAHAELEIAVSPAIPVSNLGLRAIQKGAGLDAATDVGWRFIIIVSGEPLGLADVGLAADGTPEFRQLNYGPYVSSVAKAVERSRDTMAKRGGQIELLSIPSMYTLALWHDVGDREGTITPLDPAPAPFDAGREYPEEEFVKLLTEAAQRLGPDGSALAETVDDEDKDDHRPNDHDEDDRERS